MAAAQYFEQVQKIFIAFYQRPADPAGLKYWAQRVDAAGGDIGQVINAFASSPEAVALYGAIDATTVRGVIDSLYTALFNVPADFDAAGKQFYVDGFAAGTFTAGTIALAVLNGAQNDDLIAVNNKVQVANNFTQQVDGRALTDAYFGTGTSFSVTYAGDADAQAARGILKAVTFNAATVLNPSQVTEALKAQIANPGDAIIGQTGGQTFTLTAAIDTVTGTGGNDTITGDNATLGVSDTIKGGAGIDTLNYSDASTTGVAPQGQVSQVEVINIRNVTGSAATAAVKEVVTLSFSDFAHGGALSDSTITIANTGGPATVTLTASATGTNIAAQVAALTFVNYDVTGVSGNTVTLTAKTAGVETDVTASIVLAGASTGGASAAAVNTQGAAAVASSAVALTVNAANFAGATDFNTNLSAGALTFDNVSAGQAIGANGNGATTVGALTGTYGAAVTTAALNLTGGLQTGAAGGTLQGAGAVAVNGAGVATANVKSSGAANAVGGIAFGGTAVTTLNIAADSAFGLTGATTITGFSGTQTSTVNVTGAGAVRVNVLDAALDVYNASAATGVQTLSLGAATQKVTTGSANDVITTNGALTTGSVDAGAGTADRLVVTASADVATATLGAMYKGFEQVQVQDSQSVDMALLAANNTIDTVRLNNAAGTATVSNLNAAQAGNIVITGAAAGLITIGVKDANTGGQIDTVKATLTTTTAAGALQNISLAAIDLSGVEKLELTGNGTAAATTGFVTLGTAAAISLDSIKLTNAGNGNVVTIAGGHAATNLLVDASASTGNTTLNATAYNTLTGASLKGGSGNDTLLGSARVDNLTGGAGRDIFDNNNNNSTAAATDKISDFGKITAAVTAVATLAKATFQDATETRGGANADLIDIGTLAAARSTVMATATDVATASGNAALDIKATLDARGLVTLSGANAAEINTVAEALAVFNSLNSVANGVGVVNLNGNAYVIQETAADTNFVVELTGVTLTGLSIIGTAGTGLVGEAFVI